MKNKIGKNVAVNYVQFLQYVYNEEKQVDLE